MKQIILILVFMSGLIHISKSQTVSPPQKLRFGFDLGFNYSYLQLQKSEQNIFMDIIPTSGSGFRIGLIADYSFNKLISIAPKSELSFNAISLTYVNNDGSTMVRNVNNLTLEVASHAILNLSCKNTKPYILIGPSVKLAMPANWSKPNPTDLNASVVSGDIGFGIDKTLKYFNISPEIRYSYGMNNLAYIEGAKKLQFHTITIVLLFKG